MSTQKLLKLAEENNGKLPAHTFPGAYPIAYLDSENSVLCPDCATKSLLDDEEVPQFKPVDWFSITDTESEAEYCDQCSKEIS